MIQKFPGISYKYGEEQETDISESMSSLFTGLCKNLFANDVCINTVIIL